MKLTTTLRLLRKANACAPRYIHLRASLSSKEYGDDTPINLLTILKTNGLADALWALRAAEQNCDKAARLIAADFAEFVLPIWQTRHPDDNRPAIAIQAARDYANGLITLEDLSAARIAVASAWSSAWAADAARKAAWDATAWVDANAAAAAAAAAAWDAEAAQVSAAATAAAARYTERARQREIFIHYLQEEA